MSANQAAFPIAAMARALGVSEAGLAGVSRRKGTRATTRRDAGARPAPDLVERDFTATAPDQLWVADITYVPTWTGFLYLAVVLDAFSRRVVGWAMENHLRAELVLRALDMAVAQRRPAGVVHHGDQGPQPRFCPSSNALRQARRLADGGSGSSGLEAMRPAAGAASGAVGWFGA